MEIIDAIFQSGVLIPGLALCFGFYIGYVLLSARNVVPMTRKKQRSCGNFIKKQNVAKLKVGRK